MSPASKDEWGLARRASVAEGSIAYDVFGDGPPVVFVHGTPTWSYLWRRIVPRLSERFAIYVYDLLGYGASTCSEGADISVTAQAQVLTQLLDRWGLDRPALAGHDIGAAAILRAHLLDGRPARCIALIDGVVLRPWITSTTRHMQKHLDAYRTMPAHIYEQIVATHLRSAVSGPMDDDTLEAYMAQWRGERGQAAYFNKVAHFDEASTGDFEPLLTHLSVPVLILWGREDAWLKVKFAERLYDLVPGAELAVIPNAGHFVMEDAPEEVARSLLRFFTRDD